MSRRKKDPLRELTEPERHELDPLSRSQAAPAVEVTRAKILLAVAARRRLPGRRPLRRPPLRRRRLAPRRPLQRRGHRRSGRDDAVSAPVDNAPQCNDHGRPASSFGAVA